MSSKCLISKSKLFSCQILQINLSERRFLHSSLLSLIKWGRSNRLDLTRKNNNELFYSTKPPEQLLVKSYGNPQDVTKETFELPNNLGPKQVLAQVLASPVNPADINTIQGVYAIKPECPFVPGNEAVMEVVRRGAGVAGLSVGDRVIPKLNGMGTWRTHVVVEEDQVIKIPSDLDLATASTVAVNPCTAYRMLADFVDLEAGDVVIQNCANSAVGQAAIQIAASKGILTVNVVRQRPNFEELKDFLMSLGATLVVADSDLRGLKGSPQGLPKPVLALNGVSGRPGTELLRQLEDGGTMVTYGGMSRQPLTVPVGSLIFNDVILRGFWMTRWTKAHENDAQRSSMLEDLFRLARSGGLLPPPHDLVPLSDYKTALDRAMPAQGMLGRKQILTFH